jgi:hypothetical protein
MEVIGQNSVFIKQLTGTSDSTIEDKSCRSVATRLLVFKVSFKVHGVLVQ